MLQNAAERLLSAIFVQLELQLQLQLEEQQQGPHGGAAAAEELQLEEQRPAELRTCVMLLLIFANVLFQKKLEGLIRPLKGLTQCNQD